MNYEINEFQDIAGNYCTYAARATYRGVTTDLYSYKCDITGERTYIVDGIGTPMTKYSDLNTAFQDFMTIKNVRKAEATGGLRLISRRLLENA
jgi:hypothetical protein